MAPTCIIRSQGVPSSRYFSHTLSRSTSVSAKNNSSSSFLQHSSKPLYVIGGCRYNSFYQSQLSNFSPHHHTPRPLITTTTARSLHSSNASSANNKPDEPAADDEMSEPTGLIATEGIECLTMQTPNGFKASILLEELKDAYGEDKFPKVTYQTVNIMKNTQKEPWFTAINPNGRIPAIVDHNRNKFPVMEGQAILHYITKHYDPENKFSFAYDSDDYSVCEQWISWQHGGLGPMQGQANHFFRFAKEKIHYGIQRYVGEAERLYGILNTRLQDRDFVAGPGRGKYSIADMAILGWANIAVFSGVDLHKLFPNVAAWSARCQARPATKRGFAIPSESFLANDKYLKKVEEDPEAKKGFEEATTLLEKAKEQYGYKFASP
ncbi:unnamed protein product [Discula destructiva]